MTTAIVELLVRSSVLFGLAGCAALLLRRRAASVQAFALTMALAASLALPAIAGMPAWEVAVLEPAPGVPAPMPAARASAGETAALEVPEPAVASASGRDAVREPRPTPDTGLRESVVNREAAVVTTALAIWSLGCLGVLVRLVMSHVRLGRLVRHSRSILDARWDAAARVVCDELGIARRVVIRASDDVEVPMVTGVRRPTILVPSAAEGWPPAVRRDVLRHELAHVARCDAWGQIVGRVTCALYWFNPLAWALAARAAALRERACDDEVLRAGTRASEYAARLIVLVRECGERGPEAAALAMATPSRIRERIAHVLAADVRRGRADVRAAAATAAIVLMTLLPVGLVRPVRALAVAPPPAPIPVSSASSSSPSRAPEVVTAPVVRAVAAAGQARNGMCTGRMRNSSSSNTSDNGRRRWRVQMTGDGCTVDLQAEGRVEFNDDFTDVARLETDGSFRLDATIDGTRRELDIVSRGGTLERTWRVGGREQPWDAAARAWFAEFLIAIDRRTGVGVDVRLPRLLQQGGVGAVLAETALMASDYARDRYYAGLFDDRQLTAVERRQVLDQAAGAIQSDHYAHELLHRVVEQGRIEDAAERDAVVLMLKNMESDHYRAETVKALAGETLNAAQSKALLDVLASMDSDHYKHEVLRQIVTEAPAGVDFTVVSAIIRGMDSDHYRAESVQVLARRRPDAIQTATLLPMVGVMQSDHYQNEVLRDLLDTRQSEADLLTAVEMVRKMDSDHYQAEALRAVLANDGATDRVRQAVRDVAASLSQHYRDTVLRRVR